MNVLKRMEKEGLFLYHLEVCGSVSRKHASKLPIFLQLYAILKQGDLSQTIAQSLFYISRGLNGI